MQTNTPALSLFILTEHAYSEETFIVFSPLCGIQLRFRLSSVISMHLIVLMLFCSHREIEMCATCPEAYMCA